ncbi:ADM_collapsed_G0022370.mRNA.1.CDS.1 [Saccharomyces cerevisiae]|nr:ADM_collapsed_G0022370.mRNA.1.CDS.1 [Saccharomyces cerevisiae]
MSFLILTSKAPFWINLADSFTPTLTRDEKMQIKIDFPHETFGGRYECRSFICNFPLKMEKAFMIEVNNKGRKTAYVYSGRLFCNTCIFWSPSESDEFALLVTWYTGATRSDSIIVYIVINRSSCVKLELNLKKNIS